MERDDIIDNFAEFLKENYYSEILSLISQDKKSINIDFSLLDKFSPELCDLILENPEETIPILEESFKQLDLPGNVSLRIRFFNLPKEREIRIRNIRAQHIGKLLVVEGIVKRASEVRPEVSEAIFLCPDCGKTISVLQTERTIKPPTECDCGCKKGFKFVDQKLYDARWIVIEEPFEIVSGERPSEIMVFLKEDLTSPRMQNKTDPGNRIKVVGILKELPKRMKGTRSRQVEIYIEANSIENVEVEWEELEITPEDEKRILELARDPQIYEKLVRSIGPSLYGLEDVKEAIVLQLFGGEPHIQKDKSRVRGDIHILLIGDPSCLVGDERVVLANGSIVKISSLGKEHLQKITVPVYLAEGCKRGIAKVFHKYEFQPVIEIVTESGKSIKGTFNQPVLVKKKSGKFGKFKSEWKRLDEIKIGDEVRVINRIPCRIYKYLETGWDLKNSSKRKKIKVPKVLDEKLASILGYLLANGYVQKYRVGCTFNYEELDLLPKMKKLFEEIFGIKPTFDYHKEKNGTNVEMVFNSIELAEILQFLKNKRVPDMILSSKNSVVAAFLSWLYDGNGSVISGGKGKNCIFYKTRDIELLRDIQLLLLRFGIHSQIYGNNLMIRQANSIIKFANFIGFNSKKKNEKLKKLVEMVKKLKRKRYNKRWERIVKIIYHPPEDVYDIEVPIYHKFVANGIVCHNTAKSALMKIVSSLIPRGRYVSGKGVSIDYDDPVIYREKGLIKTDLIGRLCDKFFKQDEVGFIKVKDIEVPVFDLNTFKISWKPVTYIFRHTVEEPLLKLTLRTGREVRVTAGHSIYTLDNGKIVAKRADELKVGDFILIPSRIPPNDKIIRKIVVTDLIKNHPEIRPKTLKRFPKEIKVNAELMRLIGYYIAEGYLNEGKEHWKIRFELGDKDEEIIKDIKRIVKKLFGIEVKEYKKKNSKGKVLEINSKLLVLIFKEILQVGRNAKTKKIPPIIFNTSSKNQLEFIKAYLKGDYGVTTSKELASDLQYLFLLNGIISSFSRRRIKGKIKFPDLSLVDTTTYELKNPKVSRLIKGIISISKIHRYPPLKYFKSEKILKLAKSGYRRITKTARRMLFSPYNRLLFKRLEMLSGGASAEDLARVWKINKKSASDYLNSLVRKGFAFKLYKKGKAKYFLTTKGKLLLEEVKLINSLLLSDLGFVEIKRIEKIKPSKKFVYDLGVENFNNFVAGFGGVVCHNTAAGLTATVVRDEEFLGGWVLEAGALVMCNGSLCAIDEFEKVEKSDQIALHEAMEQQSISIAKASIVATLPARTSILAGGNPKLGRFDPYLPIKEQIDIPETLLARFDLKFALRDIPNPELDAKIAEHILKARHYEEEEIKPEIEPELIRKYVAYARKNCHPKLSKEAGEVLKEFFVKLREKASEEEAPVPITLRQYEALIRLAEASAKVQLRNEVNVEDAMRAIRLMKVSLRQFGFDPETGKIDIDRAEGHIPSSQRGKIRTMLDIIDELSQTFGKNIPVDEIVKRAREKGIDNAENILRSMKSEGIVFEPSPGFIQKI